MFIVDHTIEDLNVREKNIFKVFFSMNNHQVATPEMMLEDARSYIMFFREARDKISAYIGLHLLLTDRKLFYVHSSNPFPAEELEAIQEEALEFAEGLGAMIDELDLVKLSPEEVNRWVDRQDIFKGKSEPRNAPETHEVRHPAPPPQLAPDAQQVAPQIPEAAQPQPVSGASAIPSTERYQQKSPSGQPVSQQSLASAPENQPSKQVQPAPSSPPSQQQSAPETYATQSSQDQHVRSARDDRREGPEAMQEESSSYARPLEHEPAGKKTESPPHMQRTIGAAPAEKQVKPASRTVGSKTPPASPRSRQDLFQQAIDRGFVKVPKMSANKETQSASGVVSREREALARLLTSF